MSEQEKNKKRLADIIRSRLLRKYGGLKTAVRNLGLHSYDALRQDLSKNRFFERDLLKLCPDINLPSDLASLKEGYDFTVKSSARGARRLDQPTSLDSPTLNDVFNIIDARMARLEQLTTSTKEVVPGFFEAMARGDLLAVFMSDELPSHWVGSEAAKWATTLKSALDRDAAIVYFHPSAQVALQIRQNGCTAQMLTSDYVVPAFEAFCARLTGIGATPGQLNNLAVLSCNNPAAFVPQHRYGLYFHRSENSLLVRATENIPVERSSENNLAHSRYWMLPLSYQFASFLQQICEWTLNSEIRQSTENKNRAEQLQQILVRCYFVDKKERS